MILDLLNFEFLSPDYILKKLGLDELRKDSSSNSYGMDRNGNLFSNLGAIFIILVFLAILGTALILLAKLLWKFPIVKKAFNYVYDIVVFNAILRSLV